MYIHWQSPTWYTGHIVVSFLWAHTLCKHVTCIHSPGTGKLLKQDHYQGRDLPQGVEGVEWPIIPRSHPVVQYPCHRLQHHHVCACVYYIHKCQYECVHAVCPAPPLITFTDRACPYLQKNVSVSQYGGNINNTFLEQKPTPCVCLLGRYRK